MEEQESNQFVEWVNTLTTTDVANILLMITFTLFIVILVVRAFRNKPTI